MRNSGIFFFLIVLAVLAALFFQSVRRVEIPQRQLLCRLNSGTQELLFVCPKGNHFNLVVGMPKGDAISKLEVFGKFSIKAGTNSITEFEFDTGKCTKANWLDKENLDSFVITLPTNEPPNRLDEQLQKASSIAVDVETNGLIGNSISLWLTYLAHPSDIKK